MMLGGLFVMWFAFVFAIVLVPIGFTIYALVEIVRAPDAAFGPPWDNSKNAWSLGMAVAFVIPAGVIVAPILWWTSGHAALRRRELVPRPFWAPRPPMAYPPPYHGQPPYPAPQQPPPSS
jgi:hypothetical protein